MTEENSSSGNRENAATIPSGELPDSIEKLLQERQKIDALLKEKYTRQVTVLFSEERKSRHVARSKACSQVLQVFQ